MASSVLWNETTIRRKDFSGENECRGTCVVRSARIESRDEVVKSWDERRFCGSSSAWRSGMMESLDLARTVMRRVLEGGEGCISGGRLDRSRVREVRLGFCDGLNEGESGGEADIILAIDASDSRRYEFVVGLETVDDRDMMSSVQRGR